MKIEWLHNICDVGLYHSRAVQHLQFAHDFSLHAKSYSASKTQLNRIKESELSIHRQDRKLTTKEDGWKSWSACASENRWLHETRKSAENRHGWLKFLAVSTSGGLDSS
jgi:hypothetical protein